MQPFTCVTGPAAVLRRANLDTDVIIRIERLAGDSRPELARYAFEALRYLADGTEDPEFPLNRPTFRGAPILLAGANFGCGSSREGAVRAILALGIRCIIAPSFGDIFHGNCFQNGLLPIVLDESRWQALADRAADGTPLRVDLRTQTLSWPDGTSIPFEIDDLRRDALLAGLDPIGLTLRDSDVISAWQARDRINRPWVWELGRPQPAIIDRPGSAESVS